MDHDKVPVDVCVCGRTTRRWQELTERYPDDYEAWIFYALTLQATAPPKDRVDLRESAQVGGDSREAPTIKSREHPGVLHFLIHAYDYPPLAEKGIAAAKRSTGARPAAPHARHMPSHIYSMVRNVGRIDRVELVCGRSCHSGV